MPASRSGPALVFALAATRPEAAGPALLIAALLAEFAVDFLASSMRNTISRARRASPRSAGRAWVYGIDAALSGIGYWSRARTCTEHPAHVLFLVPLLGLFAFFSRERRRRLGEPARAQQRLPWHGARARRRGRGRRRLYRRAQQGRGRARAGSRRATRPRRRAGRNLEFAALLHDVGKIAMPKEIINKPGQARPGGVDDHQDPHGRGRSGCSPASAASCARSA